MTNYPMGSLTSSHRAEGSAVWAKVIDHRKCIGCHACTVACKAEHSVPLGVNRTYVKQVETGEFPHVQRHFQVTRCNQCDNPPCVHICPTQAMFRRPDGIVDFNRQICIGCKACMAACPYDAIYIDPRSKSAEKCNFCTHRIDVGLEPACVVVCPVEAIIVGPLDGEPVKGLVNREKVVVRKPEKGTDPKLFYIDAHEATLRPTAAVQPARNGTSDGNHSLAFAQWHVGHRTTVHSEPLAEPLVRSTVTYETPSKRPWGLAVSAYLWTKSLASGTFLLPVTLSLLGMSLSSSQMLAFALLALAWLAVTGALLVADLTHPERFYLILIRPHWRSWLARGAFVILAYGVVLTAYVPSVLWSARPFSLAVEIVGAMLAVIVAVYTAFLFAQARGRDLWQNSLLPAHLAIQALLAGSAILLLTATVWPSALAAWQPAIYVQAILAGLHLVAATSDAFVKHPTQDAELAARALHAGPYKSRFWIGLALSGGAPLLLAALGSLAAPAIAGVLSIATLLGLALYDHAYVQAGQVVPLR